jgi:hypothetical protein
MSVPACPTCGTWLAWGIPKVPVTGRGDIRHPPGVRGQWDTFRVNPISDAFSPIIGLPSWSVRQGHGSFVDLEFGEPVLTVGSPENRLIFLDEAPPRTLVRPARVSGEWNLWIYCCEWSLMLNGTQLAHCESDRVRIARALNVLNGQSLTDLTVDPGTAKTDFSFDLGCTLRTRPAPPGTYEHEPVEQWLIRNPSGVWLTVRGDGGYRLESKEAMSDDTGWKPLPPLED